MSITRDDELRERAREWISDVLEWFLENRETQNVVVYEPDHIVLGFAFPSIDVHEAAENWAINNGLIYRVAEGEVKRIYFAKERFPSIM
jgi:hypothetical protein